MPLEVLEGKLNKLRSEGLLHEIGELEIFFADGLRKFEKNLKWWCAESTEKWKVHPEREFPNKQLSHS